MAESPNGAASGADYDPLQVNLPIFDGPLDLLLHLVRKQQLDIHELRMAELTEPYLAYLEQMKDLNLDQGGEFLTLASTLIWIKSKGLLPRDFEDEEPDPETVEELLVLRLQDYQKIKDAAHDLAGLDLLGRDIFPRQQVPEPRPPSQGPVPPFEEVSLFGLIEAFREVLERSQADHALHLMPERNRVEDKLGEMLEVLAQRRTLFFHDLFASHAGRAEIILTFIALLELVRLKAIRLVQANPKGEILCECTETFIEKGVVWKTELLGSLLDGPAAAPPPEE